MSSALTIIDSNAKAAAALRLQWYPLPECGPGDVLVEMIGSPVNPMDLHVVAGTYPVKPKNTIGSACIPGEDGAARVVRTGPDVDKLKSGDIVIPRHGGFGCWRTHAVCRAEELWKLPAVCTDLRLACILRMTVLPAYFLLTDLRALKEGEWIIHDAGTSSISQIICQFARVLGVRTISVFRNRPSAEQHASTCAALSAMGSTLPISEAELEDDSLFADKKVVLGLDAVWSDVTEAMIQRLSSGAVFASYGVLGAGSSAGTIRVRQLELFAKGITMKGFRSSLATSFRSEAELDALLCWVGELSAQGRLRAPELAEIAWPATAADGAEKALLQSIDAAQECKLGRSKSIFMMENNS